MAARADATPLPRLGGAGDEQAALDENGHRNRQAHAQQVPNDARIGRIQALERLEAMEVAVRPHVQHQCQNLQPDHDRRGIVEQVLALHQHTQPPGHPERVARVEAVAAATAATTTATWICASMTIRRPSKS